MSEQGQDVEEEQSRFPSKWDSRAIPWPGPTLVVHWCPNLEWPPPGRWGLWLSGVSKGYWR